MVGQQLGLTTGLRHTCLKLALYMSHNTSRCQCQTNQGHVLITTFPGIPEATHEPYKEREWASHSGKDAQRVPHPVRNEHSIVSRCQRGLRGTGPTHALDTRRIRQNTRICHDIISASKHVIHLEDTANDTLKIHDICSLSTYWHVCSKKKYSASSLLNRLD